MARLTNVAVIGVGELGAKHARVYTELPEAQLVGVCDVDSDRANEVASLYGVVGTTNFRELIPRIDAASVSVPTEDHAEVGIALLEAGVHVLVEKPIASTVGEAENLVSCAKKNSLTLAVGHIERYNPVVETVLAQSNDPRFIEVHRLGVFSARSLDIDVILDLMIHDLDVISSLVGREVVSLDAIGVPVITEKLDIANARLKFAGGTVANITASRVSTEKVRKLRVFERDCYVSMDYDSQVAQRYRIQSIGKSGANDIIKEDLSVPYEEPLRRELKDFLKSVAESCAPCVSGEDGRNALALGLRVVEAINKP